MDHERHEPHETFSPSSSKLFVFLVSFVVNHLMDCGFAALGHPWFNRPFLLTADYADFTDIHQRLSGRRRRERRTRAVREAHRDPGAIRRSRPAIDTHSRSTPGELICPPKPLTQAEARTPCSNADFVYSHGRKETGVPGNQLMRLAIFIGFG
jgi:hypothetical protein